MYSLKDSPFPLCNVLSFWVVLFFLDKKSPVSPRLILNSKGLSH